MKNYSPGMRVVTLLDGAEATGAGEWVTLPREKTITVEGISTATVDIEYRLNGDVTEATLHSFTADGSQANSDVLPQVRANVSAYTSGTISVYAAFNEE